MQEVLDVILVDIQQHAHPLDLGVGIDRQPAGLPQRVHLSDQVLHQFRRRRRAGPGIRPRQIVDGYRNQPLRNGRQTHRSRCLAQEPRADAAAACLVL